MNKYKVLWTKTANEDLKSIIDYISIKSIVNAIDQFQRIKISAEKLTTFPAQGRIVPELAEQNIFIYHELIISPWRLLYKIEDSIVLVLAVIDSRRNIEDILLNRQLR